MDLHFSINGRGARLNFNHGKANEIGRAQLRELEQIIEALEASSAVFLLSTSSKVSSRGTPIFAAGANVEERLAWSPAEVQGHVRWQRRILDRLGRLPLFHVALIEGVAFGWGLEYALCADYRLATTQARFAAPETGLGIVPGAGGTAKLVAQVGLAQALRLGMTGEVIDADGALELGLVQECYEGPEAAHLRAQALRQLVDRRSPTAIAAFKTAAIAGLGEPLPARLALEDEAYQRCINSGDAAIGRASFAAIRKGQRPAFGERQ